jgi:ketosteroid isomerase-like protein
MVDVDAEKRKILQHIEDFEDAYNRKDIEGILECTTENFLLMSHRGKYEGRETVGDRLKESMKTFVSAKHVPVRVEVSSLGDMAWLLGHETNKREIDGNIREASADYLMVFRKVNGKWKQDAVCLT